MTMSNFFASLASDPHQPLPVNQDRADYLADCKRHGVTPGVESRPGNLPIVDASAGMKVARPEPIKLAEARKLAVEQSPALDNRSEALTIHFLRSAADALDRANQCLDWAASLRADPGDCERVQRKIRDLAAAIKAIETA